MLFFVTFFFNTFRLLGSTTVIADSNARNAFQEVLTEHIVNLLQSMRSQRHDFSNHLQVISGLCQTRDYDSLQEYVARLSRDVHVVQEVLKIGHPFIGALLNAKIAEAESKGIRVHIGIFTSLKDYNDKALELVRIISNLVDNAMEHVATLADSEKRWVSVHISEEGPVLKIKVSNPGSIAPEVVRHMFSIEMVSSKNGHSGLGLYICKLLCTKLHGYIACHPEASGLVNFCVLVPKP